MDMPMDYYVWSAMLKHYQYTCQS